MSPLSLPLTPHARMGREGSGGRSVVTSRSSLPAGGRSALARERRAAHDPGMDPPLAEQGLPARYSFRTSQRLVRGYQECVEDRVRILLSRGAAV